MKDRIKIIIIIMLILNDSLIIIIIRGERFILIAQILDELT